MARDLVFEYVRVSGGKAGSASVGRYLVANHALQEVKASYGSLSAFADHYSDTFELFDSGDESYDYQIVLRKEVTAYRCTDEHFFISSLESSLESSRQLLPFEAAFVLAESQHAPKRSPLGARNCLQSA
jgi:hypothetical protein